MTEKSEQPSKRKAKKQKKFKPKARTPRGFRDMAGAELRLQNHMLKTISDKSMRLTALRRSTLLLLNMPMRWASFYPMMTAPMRACLRWKMMTGNG